jgi:hypothetical protein
VLRDESKKIRGIELKPSKSFAIVDMLVYLKCK